MNSKAVSVVIPIYNSEAYIASCIESVLGQTFHDFEMILVDDGSKDASGAICDDFARRDDRIKVRHQSNMGRTEARAQGVWMAQGEWITFVDSDDCLPPDALAKLFAATSTETDIVLGNGYMLPEAFRKPVIAIDEFRHLTVRAEGSIGLPWGSFYRRTLLLPWVFDLPRHIVNGEDYLFWLRLVFLTDKAVHVVTDSVYDKGEEHTCNTFVWTAEYCYELNELRKASIPSASHDLYLTDMLHDRIDNLFNVAVWSNRRSWIKSDFYHDILGDMQKCGQSFSLKQRLFLSIPSRWVRKQLSAGAVTIPYNIYAFFRNSLKRHA